MARASRSAHHSAAHTPADDDDDDDDDNDDNYNHRRDNEAATYHSTAELAPARTLVTSTRSIVTSTQRVEEEKLERCHPRSTVEKQHLR
jgi:hypothetical protein